MLQGQGDGGPTRKPKPSDRSQTRMRDGGGVPDGVRGAEARPTPLPKVNFTLLGLGPSNKSRVRGPAAPPLGVLAPRPHEHWEQRAAHEQREQYPAYGPPERHTAYEQQEQYPNEYEQRDWYQTYEQAEQYQAYEQSERYQVYEQPEQYAAYAERAQYAGEADDVQLPSDAELEALLRRVDAKAEHTIELDARPVRPPWLRGSRRRTIWAGLALYLAVGSASFLWFAQRAKKAAPEVAQTAAEPVALAIEQAPTEPLVVEQASAPAATAAIPAASPASAEPAAKPASAPTPQLRKAERQPERRLHKKKSKRSAKLAARAKRKKRAARAAQPY